MESRMFGRKQADCDGARECVCVVAWDMDTPTGPGCMVLIDVRTASRARLEMKSKDNDGMYDGTFGMRTDKDTQKTSN
jgi:hypothetical protein